MTRSRKISIAAFSLALAVCLQGCGRRGPLEPPPGVAGVEVPATTGVYGGLTSTSGLAPIDAASVAPPRDAAAAEAGAKTRAPRAFPLDPLL